MTNNCRVEAEQSGLSTRVLPDGRVEQSFQHTGKFWGEQGREIATAVSMWRPDGSFSFEVNGYFFTKGGESVSFKGQGVGWPTGAGWKASIRGAAQYWTSSQKLAPANKDDRSVRGRSERGRDGPRKGLGLEVGSSTPLFDSSRESQKAMEKGLLDSHG